MPSVRTICSGVCRRFFVVMMNPVFLPYERGNKTTPLTNGPKIWGQANLTRSGRPDRITPEKLGTILQYPGLYAFTSRTIIEPLELIVESQRIAESRWVSEEGELEEGLLSVAAPIRDFSGTVVAAANISMSDRARTSVTIARLVDSLMRSTEANEHGLGRR